MRGAGRRTIVVATLSVLVACGGEDVTPSASPEPTDASSSAPVPATTTAVPTVPPALVLLPDGLGEVAFGDPVDQALPVLVGALGTPDDERSAHDPDLWGYLADGPDVDGRIRLVTWGPLTVVFLDRSGTVSPAALPFAAWTMNAGGGDEPSLVTPEEIGLGSTLADLEAAYGDDLTVPDELGGPCGISWVFEVDTDAGAYRGAFEGEPTAPSTPIVAIGAGTQPSC